MTLTALRAHRRWALAALALAVAAAAMAAGTATEHGEARGTPPSPISELRIEGPKRNLLPETWYVTGTEQLRRARGNACKRRKGRIEVPGATALGITETAARTSRDLPPVRVRPDDFGLFVCEIGGLVGRPFDDPDGFSGWVYWLDFAGGTQAAENEMLAGGERVLWAFSDFGSANRNTGGALELDGVPAYDADGTFTVEVSAHGFDGTPSPLAGARIRGAEDVTDNGDGTYQVTVGNGFTTLFARHRPDIASNQITVCVRASAAACPAAHGRTIVGSGSGDVIDGTAGWDEVTSRGGDDTVRIHADGGRDTVHCGAGDDEVIVLDGDTDDEIDPSCEEVTPAS